MRTIALVIFFALSSKLPLQPTQNKISGVSPLAIMSDMVKTFITVLLINLLFNLHHLSN